MPNTVGLSVAAGFTYGVLNKQGITFNGNFYCIKLHRTNHKLGGVSGPLGLSQIPANFLRD